MAYQLTLDDLQSAPPKAMKSSSSPKYELTEEDLRTPPYNPTKTGGKKAPGNAQSRMFYQPSDDFEGQQKVRQQENKEFFPGAAQGFGNSLIGLGNLIPGVNMTKIDRAPHTPAARSGEMAGDLASYFLPGGALKLAKGVKPVGQAFKALESMPIRNAIAKLLGHAGEGAVFGAAHAPEGDQGVEAAKGAGVGGGINLATQLLRTRNPFVNAAMRALAGGGAGYFGGPAVGVSPTQGAIAGSSMGVFAPHALQSVGIGKGKAGLETLEHLTEEQVAPAVQAGRRLGTPITPAEASGNPYVGKQEGRFGRTGEGAAEKTAIGLERVEQQKGAINELLDTIYDKSPLLDQKKRDLYQAAYKWNIKPEVVDKFKSDPVIEQAFKDVEKDPAWRRKLGGIPENNYAYLDKVKTAISNEEGRLLKAGEKEKAAEYTQARKAMVEVLDQSNPAYKDAREIAQKSILRSQIQKALKTKEIKGSTFYNTFLKNENKFDDLIADLKNVPEAQDKLKDMRLAWKDLINIEKPNSAAYREESGLSQSRNTFSKLIDIYNEMTGAKRNIKALRFIHSPDWDKSFKEIQGIKDARKRNDALADLVGKVSSFETLEK